MSRLSDLARQFGGRERGGAIVVPAEKLVEFLTAARDELLAVPYIDCLYLGATFTEPSMELSRMPSDFATWEEFMAFASDASAKAVTGGQTRGGEAVFEVGP